MSTRHYTVIVAGGGPTGSSAAYTLAKNGIRVCIVDKALFPRDKLCGGLLTLKSKKIFSKIFDDSFSDTIEYTAHGADIFYKQKQLSSIRNHGEFFFTRRSSFDHHLIDLADREGAELILGNGISTLDLSTKTCILSSGESLTFDYLIGADGANSKVAKTIFGKAFDTSKVAFAVETEIDRKRVKRDILYPEIYFGIVRWGYGWIFPKKDTLTVGIGGLNKKNPNIKNTFTRFLTETFGDNAWGDIKGHHIPFGDYKKHPGVGSVLLAGDAAGLVDPITGEGIAFAMESGYFAGIAIAETLSSQQQKSAIERYQKRYSQITRTLDHANLLRYLLFPKPLESLFVRTLPKTRTLPQKHMDLMSGDIDYKTYMKYIALHGLKRFFMIPSHLI